ncbi:hypothetical protein GCM10011348_40000 [Marinobacterium nitratireducens]|uniref:Uncharacterized protein n=1 Tax=Marinobacterium nitratireducens TaxID=518897 RepID=A0A917ZNA1_9GAMM|nr:hypothetical protein [Marinobacterium nitratireducens]GGO87250.1 hypothetical protein GCM10011348_40000 [Marinobacterium nitratireducens]
MKKLTLVLTATLMASSASAGLLDPDCTAEKAAKSAVAKSTIGVGGRCTPAEAAKDMASDKVEDMAPEGAGKAMDKLGHKDEPSVKKAVKKAID